MPTNVVVINNTHRYEVPDSWMPVLMAYLNMVKEKTEGKVLIDEAEYENLTMQGKEDTRRDG